MLTVLMVRYGYLEAPLHMKEEWRYVLTELGEQYVASLLGGSEKLMLYVGNLDTIFLVRINCREQLRSPYTKCGYLLIHAPCLTRYTVTNVSLLARIEMDCCSYTINMKMVPSI